MNRVSDHRHACQHFYHVCPSTINRTRKSPVIAIYIESNRENVFRLMVSDSNHACVATSTCNG